MESGLANLALGLGIGRDVRYFPFDFPMKSSQSGNADVISKETSNLFILPPHPPSDHPHYLYLSNLLK